MSRLFIPILLALGFGISFQVLGEDIYKTVDENGNVQYSDQVPDSDQIPAGKIEQVELPEINVQPAVVPRVRLSPPPAIGPGPIQAWISAPDNEHVVNPGEQSFSVSGGVSRDLLDDEYARLLVNGSTYGSDSKNLNWAVGSLVRGEYKIQVQIVAEGEVRSTSDTRSVFVQRAFVR